MTSWQTKKLGDIAIIKRGGSPRPIHDFIVAQNEEGYNWLKIGDVSHTSRYIYKTTSKIKPEGLSKTTLVKKGDFILSNSMSFGRPYIMMVDACIHDGWLTLQDIDKSMDKYFLYYLLMSDYMQNKFKNISAGSGVQNLKRETVMFVDFKSPPKPEQQRIVAILEKWDEGIEALERKIELKEQLKKGLMQQLLTGKLRLPGFTDEWREVKLGEVARIEKGKALSSEGVIGGKYKVIAGGKTSPYSHNDYTHEDVITVSASGAYAGYVSYHGEKIWASDCSVVQGDGKTSDTKYLSHLMKFLQKRIYILQTGGAQPHVYPRDLQVVKFMLPKIEEQQAVVNVFRSIDDEISALNQKLTQLKLQKKFLLQNLITGKIRTPESMEVAR